MKQHGRGAVLQTGDYEDGEAATPGSSAAEPADLDIHDTDEAFQATSIICAAGSFNAAVTIYGPRRAGEDGGGQIKRVSAVVHRSVPGRLVLRFLNVDMKGNGKQAQKQTPNQHGSQTQVDKQQQGQEMDDEGFQGTGQRSQNKIKLKNKNKGKDKVQSRK